MKFERDEKHKLKLTHGSKNKKKRSETFLNLDDCINANYNYESLHSHLVS